MHKQLVNLIASQPYESLTPFRVMGITAFYFLKLDPALPVNEYCSIEGIYVDVKGDKDRVIVIDNEGDTTPLNPRSEGDMRIVSQLYNRIQVNQLATI